MSAPLYTLTEIWPRSWASDRPPLSKWVVHCPSDGSGFKTRAMSLAERCKGKWSKRQRGYVLSNRGLAQFQKLILEDVT